MATGLKVEEGKGNEDNQAKETNFREGGTATFQQQEEISWEVGEPGRNVTGTR